MVISTWNFTKVPNPNFKEIVSFLFFIECFIIFIFSVLESWKRDNTENEHNEILNKKVQNWRFDYNFRIGTFVLFIIGLFAYLYLTICLFVPVKVLETLLVPIKKSYVVIQCTSYLRVLLAWNATNTDCWRPIHDANLTIWPEGMIEARSNHNGYCDTRDITHHNMNTNFQKSKLFTVIFD